MKKDGTPLSSTQAINLLAEQVKEILFQLTKTISSIKVFSWQHAATQKMIHTLWENMAVFLGRHGRLEIGVEEFAFTFRDRVVYRDEKAIKSLPFLFYKDGMKQLFIDKSVKEEELVEFLKIIRDAFERPAEESDIVSVLWEKDLASIHCFAPDDFLETKISAGKMPPMLYADPADLRMGYIALSPEDRTPVPPIPDNALELDGTLDPQSFRPELPQQPETADSGGNAEASDVFTALSDGEDRALRDMLQINRKLSPNGELVLLAGEILNLETNPSRFLEVIEVLTRLHQDLITKADFHWAAELLARLIELKTSFSSPNAFQREPLTVFLNRVKSREALANLKTVLQEKRLTDFRPFFEYISQIGLDTLPLVIDLCDTLKSPAFYASMSGYLRDVGSQAPAQLLQLASVSRPALTREVIAALGSHPDKRVVLLLAAFKGSWDKGIKQEAIRALGRSTDPGAARILSDFLNDEDLDIRVFAANNIRSLRDPNLSDQIMNAVRSQNFHRKNLLERQAYLDLVGRQRTSEAYDLLEEVLRKRTGLFGGRRRVETRLAVVKTLARIGGPSSRQLLEDGTHFSGAKVRQACREALETLPVEPAATAQPLARREPSLKPESALKPAPSVGPEPRAKPEPLVRLERAVAPETQTSPEASVKPEPAAVPVSEEEAEPAVTSEPTAPPEVQAGPEPVVEAKPAAMPGPEEKAEPPAMSEPPVTPEPPIPPEAQAGPEPVVGAEPVAKPGPEEKAEPPAMSEPPVTPEPPIPPEAQAGPEPAVKPEPEAVPEVPANPEPTIKPETLAKSESPEDTHA